ncbi:MAG TPA: 16S rRNA (cytidine(1402)-2'-O)-methyltransferase [Tepidiformaceae bacterium]|nr:16S rRNA (cytidine(1402)-2'-O)-methyltransferase [Tepidiformaceae bacterium]
MRVSEFPHGLYVVATPIGNLGDLSPRAADVLRTAAIVASEDTRTTARLYRGEKHPPMVSLTEYNVGDRIPALLEAARSGVVALTSDAGSPAIADPGARLVEAAHAADVRVVAVPGPSALTAAVSVSGFEGSDVRFLGFLPRQKGERIKRLREGADTAAVFVFFESPNRLPATLAEIAAELGDPETVVCRELTKLHEEVARGRASALASKFAATKGECTVVVRSPGQDPSDERALREYLAEMREAGARRTAAAAIAARRFGVTRAAAYDAWE